MKLLDNDYYNDWKMYMCSGLRIKSITTPIYDVSVLWATKEQTV